MKRFHVHLHVDDLQVGVEGIGGEPRVGEVDCRARSRASTERSGRATNGAREGRGIGC